MTTKSKNPYLGWTDIAAMLDMLEADIEIAVEAGYDAVRRQLAIVSDAAAEWSAKWPKESRREPCYGTPFRGAYLRLHALVDEMRSDRRAQRGFVYFVSCAGASVVKIGFTTNVDARLKALKTGSAKRLEVLLVVRGTASTEREFHRRFAEYRLEGEWFELSDAIRRFVAKNAARHVSTSSNRGD